MLLPDINYLKDNHAWKDLKWTVYKREKVATNIPSRIA